jgi:ParB-like chromosome segregation protein Spo0J
LSPSSGAATAVRIRRRHTMMGREKLPIANIYVQTVQEIAQSMLEVGQQAPILVRRDGDHQLHN